MPSAPDKAAHGQASEMAIVDTFTRLIFGDEGEFNALESRIIEALRLADASVIGDSREQMGDYLRAMGVREMVDLVARVRDLVESEPSGPPINSERAGYGKVGRPPVTG